MNAPRIIPKANAATRQHWKRIEADYREWIAPFSLCVKYLCPADDLAHIRGYAQGYLKPPPWHTVPLSRQAHDEQETDRDYFYPLTVKEAQDEAEHLFNAWEINQDADEWLRRLTAFHGKITQ